MWTLSCHARWPCDETGSFCMNLIAAFDDAVRKHSDKTFLRSGDVSGRSAGQIQDTTPDPLPRAIAPNANGQSPEVSAATVARRRRHHSAEWRLTQARPPPKLNRSARCPMSEISSKGDLASWIHG